MIEAIKNEIKNLPIYEAEIKRLKEKKEELIYHEENVKGVSFDRSPGTTNSSVIAEKRLDMIEKIVRIEEEIKELKLLVNRIKRVLNAMEKEDRSLVREVLIEKKSYRQVCEEKNISSTSLLNYYIDRAVEKAIKKS